MASRPTVGGSGGTWGTEWTAFSNVSIDETGNLRNFARAQHNSAGVLQGSGFNITSTTKNSTGNYTVTWNTDFADITYSAIVTVILGSAAFATITNHPVGSITYIVNTASGALIDAQCDVIAFGTQ